MNKVSKNWYILFAPKLKNFSYFETKTCNWKKFRITLYIANAIFQFNSIRKAPIFNIWDTFKLLAEPRDKNKVNPEGLKKRALTSLASNELY